MINIYEVTETNNMVEKENLDVRTITMGISLLDCIDSDLNACLDKIYKKDYRIRKGSGKDRRRDCTGIRRADCKQAYFRYSDCAGRRRLLPI